MLEADKVQPDHRDLWQLAADQGGYFTSTQAVACGISRRLLTYHTQTGRYRRVTRSLYRLRDYPASPHEEVRAAWLALGGAPAVISHETALDLLDLTDVIPAAIHVTVPRSMRWRHVPVGVALHTVNTPVPPEDIVVRDGIRLTGPARTLLDSAALGTAPEQIVRGITTGIGRRLLIATDLQQRARNYPLRVQRLVTSTLQADNSDHGQDTETL